VVNAPADLSTIETPALILDRARLAANGAAMLRHVRALGVRLRPHMKTLKCAAALPLVIDPDHGGIAVATLNEAEYFARFGITDIQLAVCLPPGKLDRAARLARLIPRFSFFIDSLEMARAVADHIRRTGARHQVWVEVDCGEHRTGASVDSPELIDIAKALPPRAFAGVATHAGHAYAALDAGALSALADHERRSVVAAAERLRGAGLAVEGVSAGSTPTAVHLGDATGLTEIRAGVYMAGDLFQAAIGSLARDRIAVSVLATVISHDRTSGRIVIDAGGLALSKDRGTARGPGPDLGYGLVLDVEGRATFGTMIVADTHQEHGEIRDVPAAAFAALPLGARVRILPNHACMTGAMYEAYHVVDAGVSVIDQWPRTNGWS
jgi:D-serine deaminase-like pyridoxal phosphate-dependent protein